MSLSQVRSWMADLAISFHWQPSELKALSLEELVEFRDLARERTQIKRQR